MLITNVNRMRTLSLIGVLLLLVGGGSADVLIELIDVRDDSNFTLLCVDAITTLAIATPSGTTPGLYCNSITAMTNKVRSFAVTSVRLNNVTISPILSSHTTTLNATLWSHQFFSTATGTVRTVSEVTQFKLIAGLVLLFLILAIVVSLIVLCLCFIQ
jgi:hypothetical protein